jgi:hypothetical protein
MSPEFLKAALRTVKLTDLTLGDLVAMNTDLATNDKKGAPEETKRPQDAAESSSNVKLFRRAVNT